MNKVVIKVVAKHALITGAAAAIGTVVIDLVQLALAEVPALEEGS